VYTVNVYTVNVYTVTTMQLEQDTIHLWYADQSDFTLQQLEQRSLHWLRSQELQRYRRLQLERHRTQLLLSRYLVRSVLSLYAESNRPEDWCFVTNSYGKPVLDQKQHALPMPLFFNLSHSQGKLVVAIAASEALGVDVEGSTRPRRIGAIANRYFAPQEVTALQLLPVHQQLPRFYHLWTLKEAYIKARGLGLAIPLQHFAFQFGADKRINVEFAPQLLDDASHWRFWQIAAGPSHTLALACNPAQRNLALRVRMGQFYGDSTPHKLQLADAPVIRQS